MKDLCLTCKNHKSCPYGHETWAEFLYKVEDDIEEIVEEYEGIKLKPNVKLLVIECNEFREM